MAKFTISRKATAWENTTVEAESFEEAVRKVGDDYSGDTSWDFDYDSWEPTGDYFGTNEDTQEEFTN